MTWEDNIIWDLKEIGYEGAMDIGFKVNINKIKYTITSRERLNGNGHLTTDEEDLRK